MKEPGQDHQDRQNRSVSSHMAGRKGISAIPPSVLQTRASNDESAGKNEGKKPNNTGLPDKLKSGIENLSGYSMDDVRVHYNSAKPTDLQAHAYAQGTDIHIAFGQEKHLPHEAWHVVQQKEGRVKPTRQLKDMVNINDDTGLEKEADVMGEKALEVTQVKAQKIQAVSTNHTVQRKVQYSGTDGDHVNIIEQKVNAYADKEELPRIRNLGEGLVNIRSSAIDYGEIDVSEPQHVALLYHYLSKQTKMVVTENEPEKNSIESQEALAGKKDEILVKNQKLFPGRVFETAFVGAGASIAYALQTLGSNADQTQAVIIGPLQPWRKDRGPGVVAHPEHMITPQRQKAGSTSIDEIFMDRGSFSDTIEKAISDSKIKHIQHAVKDIQRRDWFDNYYGIWVPQFGDWIYAKKLIVGIGVGGHNPRGVAKEEEIAHAPEQVGNRRVFDMDIWANVAGQLSKDGDGKISLNQEAHNPSAITIILSGGNGGIDVAFDALNRGYKVQWVVGNTGPKFLPGFFNYAAYLAYLRSLKDGQLDRAGIEDRDAELRKAKRILPELYNSQQGAKAHDMFTGVVHRFMPETMQFEGIYFGRSGKASVKANGVELPEMDNSGGPIKADVFVYATGQDNKTFTLLQGLNQQLVPKTDIDKRFTDDGTTTLGLQSEDGSLEVVGATAYRMAPQVEATPEQIEYSYQEIKHWMLKALYICNLHQHSRLLFTTFSDVEQSYKKYKESYGQPGASNDLKAFDGAVEKHNEYVTSIKGQHRTPLEKKALEGFNLAISKAGNKAQGPMLNVIKSLPDNILLNDQLTSTRSQVEAAGGFVPRDAGSTVNFITDDRTVLAVHISAKYPALADERKFDDLISDIIKSRTEIIGRGPTVLPVPPNQEKFQEHWDDLLKRYEKIWK